MQKATSLYINLLLVILLIVSVFVLFHVYSKIRENKGIANWEAAFGSIEELPNRYPYRDDNEAAIEIKRLAGQLGITFADSTESRMYFPRRYGTVHFRSINLPKYLAQIYTKDDSVFAPSGLLAKYLTEYEKQMEDLRDSILTSHRILWRQDMDWTTQNWRPGPALPDMDGISNLQDIFSARVLQLEAEEDYEEAEKYLEAKWKLNESLRSRCDLTSQQAALQTDKALLCVMRKSFLNEHWIPKIAEHDYKNAYIKAFTVEVAYFWRKRREYRIATSPEFKNILHSYFHSDVSSVLENEREEIQRLAAMNPCDLGLKDYRESKTSYWNGIAVNWELYDKVRNYAQITELQLQRELTEKVIKLKHGYFPKDGIETSSVCKDSKWEYWRSPDGSITIKYKGRLELPYTSPVSFPSPFTVKTK